MTEPVWHFERDGRIVGPFPRNDLERLLEAGLIVRETILIDSEGNRAPAEQVLSGQSAQDIEVPVPSKKEAVPPPPPIPASAFPRPSSAPWSPRALVWLGLPFSPIWTGVMTALNARRLGLASPIWRPILIGVGALALREAISFFGFDSYPLTLGLYLGALLLLWQTDLEDQDRAFQARGAGQPASWLAPCLAGVPATLLVLLALVVIPLMPASPREVSEEFLKASSPQAARSLTTTNLWPALDALAAAPARPAQVTTSFEILGEETSPAELGGHLVGYRILTNAGAGTETEEAILHLLEREGRWKIEEVIYTTRNGQALEVPVRLSQSYRQVAADGGDGRMMAVQRPNSSSEPKSFLSTLSEPLKDSRVSVILGRILASGVGKMGLLFLALLGWRSMDRRRK